jgi:hypothetical protein
MSAIERRLSKIEAASIASAPAPGFFVYEAESRALAQSKAGPTLKGR